MKQFFFFYPEDNLVSILGRDVKMKAMSTKQNSLNPSHAAHFYASVDNLGVIVLLSTLFY